MEAMRFELDRAGRHLLLQRPALTEDPLERPDEGRHPGDDQTEEHYSGDGGDRSVLQVATEHLDE